MMAVSRGSTYADAFRVGVLELLIVLLGLVFVRKEVYLAGKFQFMILHWQEYALLFLMFVDGLGRGFGEAHGQGHYLSPLRKKLLRFLLPVTLFLFVSCSSLCDKLNAGAIHEEWWRDSGLLILLGGVVLSCWAQLVHPPELVAEIPPSTVPAAEEADETPQNAESALKKVAGDPVGETNSAAGNGNAESDEEANGVTKPDSTKESKSISAVGPWRVLRYPFRTAILVELIGLSMTLSAWLPLLTLPGLFVLFRWELADLEAFRISQFGQKYLEYRRKSWQLIPYLY